MRKMMILVMLLTTLSKAVGFFRDLLFSKYYGVSAVADAYLVSIAVPTVLMGFVGAGIMAAFSPIYMSVRENRGKEFGNVFVARIMLVFGLVGFVLSVAAFLCPELLVGIFAGGLSGEVRMLSVLFTRVTALSAFLAVVILLLAAYLNANSKFAVTALMGLPLNAVLMAFLYIGACKGAIWLPVGQVVAMLAQLMFLFVYSFRLGVRFDIGGCLFDEDVKKYILMAAPIVLGGASNEINLMITRAIASHMPSGAIASLGYAERLSSVICVVLTGSIIGVSFQKMSERASLCEHAGVIEIFVSSARLLLFVLIPSAIAIGVYAYDITKVMYFRGAFDERALGMTAVVTGGLALAIVPFGIRDLCIRMFYSVGEIKIPVQNSIGSIIIGCFLSVILARKFGLLGLSLSVSIVALSSVVFLLVHAKRKFVDLKVRPIALVGACIGIVSYLIFRVSLVLCALVVPNVGGGRRVLMSFLLSLLLHVFVGIVLPLKESVELRLRLRRLLDEARMA